MRRSSKAELQMLRECLWLLGSRLTCELCGMLLIPRQDEMTFGHRRHGPITVKLTVHHRDHNREHNWHENLALVHSKCHKKYHAEVNRGDRQKPQLADC